jgi:hypothetical protein
MSPQAARKTGRRFWSWCLLVASVACSTSSPTTPSSELAGTWSEVFSFPGSSLVITIDGQGSGSGTYAIEAGRSGTVSVTGTVTTSNVTLIIRYDSGMALTFSGKLADSTHLTGTFSDGTSVTFVRQ